MKSETGITADTEGNQTLVEALYRRGFTLSRIAIVNGALNDYKLTVISRAELTELRDKLTLLQLEANYLGNR